MYHRSLWSVVNDEEIDPLLIRPQEISRYVEQGILDVGLTGKDWIEDNGSDVVEVDDFTYSKATLNPIRVVLAAQNDSPIQSAKDLEGNDSLVATVRQLGTKTFYLKEDRWVDSVVKPDEEAKAIVIEQFSDDYFKLARSQVAEMNQYLTFDEPVTVNLGGKVYRIDRAKN